MGVTRRLGRWAVRLLLIGLAVWAVTIVAVLWASDRALAEHRDGRSIERPVGAAIVLGGGINPDGQLDYSSRRRVAAAVDAYKAGKTVALITAGGVITPSPRPVGELMRDHAVRLGVPADCVLVEHSSTSTLENVRFALRIADVNGIERVALATDDYHLTRAQALARYLGDRDIELIAVQALEDHRFDLRAQIILRESLAWWYNLGKVAAWEVLGVLGWSAADRARVVR